MIGAPDGLYWRVHQLIRSRAARGAAASRPAIVPAGSDAAVASAPAGGVLLEVRDVSKAFIGLQALSDVGFDVHEREILGVIGPNGAGKTTLFNVLNGFLVPDRGEVRLRGERVTGLRPSALCRRGLGRTFQVVRTFPRLSVLDNVMVGAFVHARAVGRARAVAVTALAQVGLADRADDVPAGLTTLELRLMELARCLATAPRLVLLDEPLAGLSSDGAFVPPVGPNGAGKTTLLKAISGPVTAAEGRIAYRGRDLGRMRASERAALGIAHVPEGRRVFATLSVMENLELGSYRRAARAHRAQALETVLELFPLLRARRAQLAGAL